MKNRTYWQSVCDMRNVQIIYYHDVVHDTDARPWKAGAVTISQFEEQLQYLKKHREIVSLDEALSVVMGASNRRDPVVTITFDDGCAGVRIAADVLHAMETPATVFLSTRFIGTKELPWFLHLEHLMFSAQRQRHPLQLDGCSYSLVDPRERKRFRRLAKRLLLQRTYEAQVAMLHDIANALPEESWISDSFDREFLTWNEVRELARMGVLIGSHSHSHVDLRILDNECLERELSVPLRQIRSNLPSESCDYLSYPDGRFSDRVVEFSRRFYRAALGVVAGTQSWDTFRLPRRIMLRGGEETARSALSWSHFPVQTLRNAVKRLTGIHSGEL